MPRRTCEAWCCSAGECTYALRETKTVVKASSSRGGGRDPPAAAVRDTIRPSTSAMAISTASSLPASVCSKRHASMAEMRGGAGMP